MNLALIASGFMLGLAGSGHCMAMCGGASGWILRLMSPQAGSLLRFHLGRMAGYAALGAAMALAGHELQQVAGWAGALRPLWTMANAAAFMVGAALLVTGRQPAMLDRLGQWISQRLAGGGVRRAASRPGAVAAAPVGGGVFIVPVAEVGRVDAAGRTGAAVGSHARAWKTGACWALMPCGLLYSALLLVALSGDAASGGLAMAAFAAATAVPMLLAQRLFGHAGLLRRWERAGNRLIGAAICVLAGWGVALTVSGHGQGLFCLPGAS